MGFGLQEFCSRFSRKSSTLGHSGRRRQRTTAIRTFLKDTMSSPRMGTAFRANQMSVHAQMARDRRDGRTDGQTEGFSSLYSGLQITSTCSASLM